jgi:alpha-tubulin suppressor-like RCC1 family protein
MDGVSNAAEISIGSAFLCVRTMGGTVECWGHNEEGQLGDGTTTNRDMPTPVSGLSDVTAIAAGYYSSCAQISSGAVKCWGWNGRGQLGDGSTVGSTVPVDAVLGDTAISMDVGSNHACAVTSMGKVKCWGWNPYGQLGNGRAYAESIMVTISQPIMGATSLSAGEAHTCALTSSANVWCWGANSLGQLGDGSTADRYIPVQVNGLSNVAFIAPGWYHTCAVTRSGSAMCWGYNAAGQLGDGTTQTRLTPVVVSGLDTGVASVVAGFYHSCAVLQTGGVKCWGYNAYGELGDGMTTDSATPVDVVGLTAVSAIATGAFSQHVCALTGGHVKCWGDNSTGQLGDGTWTRRLAPVPVPGLSGVTGLAVGEDYSCALLQTGKVKCWGGNQWGQLGSGSALSSTTPLEVEGVSDAVNISAGIIGTCVLTHTGVVKCWGGNLTKLNGLNGITSIAVGGSQVCMLSNTGEIKCWGSSVNGQLGIDPGWTPVTVLRFGFEHTLYLPQARHP